MKIRENLARNLKLLCEEKGNIAQICREIGISRPNFFRYLKGETLPNKNSIKKICQYFRVSESYLFNDSEYIADGITAEGILNLSGSMEIFANLSADPLPKISPGYYATYMLFGLDGTQVASCLTIIRNIRERPTFRRLTNRVEPSSSTWHYVRGDHTGIIIERESWLYFLGVADKGKREPSIISVKRVHFLPNILSGSAYVLDQTSPIYLPVVMELLPASTTLRKALKNCRMLPLSAPEISPAVKSAFEEQLK